MASTVRVRRTRDLDEVLALAEPFEPAAQMMVAVLLEHGLGRHTRAFLAERSGGGGDPAGLVVLHRWCFDRWGAMPLLFDSEVVVPIGRFLDRSRAYAVEGTAEHVHPLVPHLDRALEPRPQPYGHYGPPAGDYGPLDPRVRTATLADLEPLVALYRHYEIVRIPTVPRLRRFLHRQVELGRVLVVDEDGQVAAALRVSAPSRRYFTFVDLTVHPDHRRRGLSRAFTAHCMQICEEHSLGTVWSWAPTNPKPIPDELPDWVGDDFTPESDTWTVVRLRQPVWFRGHARLRSALERVEGRVKPRVSRAQ